MINASCTQLPARIDTVIIGAGQAGLSLSHGLTERGVAHVVLERGTVAHSWRTQRWDTFTLLSPNWQTQLPGYRYNGPEPDGFMTGAQVVGFLEDYARSFAAPIRAGIAVRRVAPVAGGWLVCTTRGPVVADHVVVATGDLSTPHLPAMRSAFPSRILQMHTRDYRNPAQLPGAGVLVVGAGPSGQQIASELRAAGRQVHLAVGRHNCLPRRYRGHDTYWWMDRLGMFDRTVESLPPGGTRIPNAVLAGGTRDLNVRRLAAEGVTVHGRLVGLRGHIARFAADLPTTLADAEDNARRFLDAVDAHVAETATDAPAERVVEPGTAAWITDPPRTLDLQDVAAVVWATGFRRDFRWIDAQVLGPDGDPVHRRGVTAATGLYFLGLRWQHRRSSASLIGIGRDAEYLADHIAGTHHRAATLAAA